MLGIDTKTNKKARPVDPRSETEEREYKSGGFVNTSKYSVDKKVKSEPSVSRPKDTKEQSDRPADANYGF